MKNKSVFISARLASSRLPKKHILKIQDKYCIEYVINRAKLVSKADFVVLCTTDLEEDDVLENIAIKNDIYVYRGSVRDRLDRWYSAAKHFNIDFFVTAGGDNLFSEPELLNMCIDQYETTSADFISWETTGIICGCFEHGIKVEALKKAIDIKTTNNTELTSCFFNNIDFKIESLMNIPSVFKRPDIRATLDYPEDYTFFKTIIELANSLNVNINSLRDIIKIIDSKPHLVLINQSRHNDWKNNQDKIKNSL